MNEPPFDKEQANRWFAVQLNNRAWDLLESTDRSDTEADEMIHAAHASVYHWLQVGTAANYARAMCLLANVYAALGRATEAVRYAGRCVELTEANAADLADWDFAFAYDCLARARAAAGDRTQAEDLRQKSREYGDQIADPEDKEFFTRWLTSGNWHGI